MGLKDLINSSVIQRWNLIFMHSMHDVHEINVLWGHHICLHVISQQDQADHIPIKYVTVGKEGVSILKTVG
jgi:hypothetical protein